MGEGRKNGRREREREREREKVKFSVCLRSVRERKKIFEPKQQHIVREGERERERGREGEREEGKKREKEREEETGKIEIETVSNFSLLVIILSGLFVLRML